MTFGRPLALWLLALALPIVLFHLHLRRRRRVVVTSVELWRGLVPVRAGRGRLRHVRDALALALVLAALAAFAGAAADPVHGAAPAPGRRLVVVLDASASLTARAGDAGSRFAAAQEAADAAIARLAPADEVVVWVAARTPFVAVDPTADHAAARAAVASLRATLEPRRLATTLRVAARAAAESSRLSGRAADLLVLTDRAGAATLAGEEFAARFAVGVVDAGGSRNAGIVAFDVDAGDATRAIVRVETTDGAPADGEVTLRRGGAVLATAPLVFAGAASATVALPLGAALREGGIVEARIERAAGPDDFAADDAARMALAPARPLAVALVAETPSPFLVEALRAMPADLVDPGRTTLVRPGAAASAFQGADVVLADAAAAPDGRPALTFGHGGRVVDRPLLWSVGAHPVTAGVDLSPLRIEHASLVEPEPGDVTIVATAAGVVGVAGERAGARRVALGFRPDATTLPLEAAFPLLVRNALRWLAQPEPIPRYVVADEPVPGGDGAVAPYPVPGGEDVLRLPSGGVTALRWARPPSFRLDAESAAPPAGEAVASLGDRSGERDTRRRMAPWLAGAAALFLAAGAALLRRPAPSRAPTAPPPSTGIATARSSREAATSPRA